MESGQQPTANSQPLSAEALRLRDYLRVYCAWPARARTDRDLAKILHLPERSIVDLADELLQAGHLVVARCKPPAGRWILLDSDHDPEHWQEARAYAQQLDARAIGIHARAKHARSALSAMEARRNVETSGQRRLF